jgi:hypothetical protein
LWFGNRKKDESREKGSRPELHGDGLEERKTANDAKLQED